MHHEAIHETVLVTYPYLRLIPLLPLLGVLFNASIGPRAGKRAISIVAPGVVGLAFVVSLFAFLDLLRLPSGASLIDRVFPWIYSGSLKLDVAFTIDPLSAVMALVVTGVGFLIHVYSTGYMGHDADYARYFTYLNLFTFAMLLLVLGDNLVVLFVGWEGVGLCSYLLIGFWYEDPEKASAGKKAFVVNRIGDAGFLLGLFLLFWSLDPEAHDLTFRSIAHQVGHLSPGVVTAICLLLFVGAMGKSAQIPLYVWLPDAMAGPTPVSALIHAATMVTAGVYMVARMNFLYTLSPFAMTWVACFGAATALFAATIGLVQNDIKKILAYSTVSQLGYMFLACGVGAFGAAIFHLMTHAFFKALLFLGSGSVIHGMSGEQDIRKMGGLRHHMPVTFWTFLLGTIAIAGIPPFSGFFSKDEILWGAFTSAGHGIPWLWLVGASGAGLTAFYMFRLVFLTFFGECRASHDVKHHIHESPWSMTVPLMILAGLSVVGGWIGIPAALQGGNQFAAFLAPVFGQHGGGEAHSMTLEIGMMGASVLIALFGIAVAVAMYQVNPEMPARLAALARGIPYRLFLNKYWVDEIYEAAVVQPIVRGSNWLWTFFDAKVVDGAVNGAAEVVMANGRVWRLLQTGNVQHYALSVLIGAVVILGYYVW
jgi:NADH-quinone oxidoreductase subunit L